MKKKYTKKQIKEAIEESRSMEVLGVWESLSYTKLVEKVREELYMYGMELRTHTKKQKIEYLYNELN